MRCPECLRSKSKVLRTIRIKTEDGDECIERTRECMACGSRFSTYEGYEPSDVESAFRLAELKPLLVRMNAILSR